MGAINGILMGVYAVLCTHCISVRQRGYDLLQVSGKCIKHVIIEIISNC